MLQQPAQMLPAACMLSHGFLRAAAAQMLRHSVTHVAAVVGAVCCWAAVACLCQADLVVVHCTVH